ncbi:MAG: choice-of-anchor D domain-containing protein, partial [Candidatus Acidiferrum sp.]
MKQGKGASVASEGRSVRAEYRILWGLLVLFLLPSVVLLDGCAGIIKPTSQAIAALFQLNPTSINFGTVTVGKKATQSVSISNMGTVAVNITQATLSNSQFSLSGGTLPMSLAAGKSGNISIAVTPSAAGTISGTLTVTGDGGSSPVVANLSATAVGPSQPQLSASPASIGFGTISNGHTGNANLVLSNTGSAPLTVSLITLTGSEFGITGIATPVTISAGQSVQATVTFSPTSAGTASGSVTITSNDPNNPTLSVPLTGTGSAAAIGQLSASPASVSFGTVATGSSTNKQVAITNTGNAAVNVSAVTASGTGYSVTGLSAPATLNPLETATLTVAFAPSAAGSAPGSVTVTSNATNSPLTIALSGTAAQAGLSVSPTSYNFGSIVDGETKSESFTITNTGTAPLTISQLSVTGSAFSASGLTLPTTIAAG